MSPNERHPCPACGGAGGGPFGRASSGWDVETYECPRCEGSGYVRMVDEEIRGPGVVKVAPSVRPRRVAIGED